jgi:hypothetical protein
MTDPTKYVTLPDYSKLYEESQWRLRRIEELSIERDSLRDVLSNVESYLNWRSDDLYGDDLIGDQKLTMGFKRIMQSIADVLHKGPQGESEL